jgi:Fe-S-cluster-containing hydrogenase component 2/CRP-like cAMP-binding protein
VVIEADRRKLVAILKAAPMFRDLAPEAIEILRTRAEACTLAPGEVVFRQSQTADALYVIRVGQVRVSQFAGQTGEVTVCYLGEGDVFGEQGLLEAGLRPVTCSAYGAEVGTRRWYAHPPPRAIRPTRVEVFRIGREACIEAFRADPRFRKRIESLARRRTEKDRTARLTPVSLPVLTDRAEAMGLPQGQRLLLIDLEACTRCDQCVQACVTAHDDGLPRLIREGPRLDTFQVPSRCRSCLDPVCMIGCPVGSIGRRDDFSMFIEDWCIGCGICAGNCPYGSIQMHPRDPRVHPAPEVPMAAIAGQAPTVTGSATVPSSTDRIAAVCDQCHGLPTGPACRYACPHDAIVITDSSKAFDVHVSQVGDSLSGSASPWSATMGTTASTRAAASDPRRRNP